MDGRPYDWVLGQPTDRIPAPVDAAVSGMREGGWRRLVVPDAYGSAGLRKVSPVRGGGRFTPPKAGYAVRPSAPAYFDLIMLDGGSGRHAFQTFEPRVLVRPPSRDLDANVMRARGNISIGSCGQNKGPKSAHQISSSPAPASSSPWQTWLAAPEMVQKRHIFRRQVRRCAQPNGHEC